MRLLAKFSLIFAIVFGFGLAAAAWLFRGSLQKSARKSDWIAIVIVDDSPRRRFFIVPHQEALKAKASRPPPASWSRVWRRIYIPFVPTVFAAYEDNFRLKL